MDVQNLEKNKELELLLTQYTTTSKSYLDNLTKGNSDAAQKDLKLLNDLNGVMLTHISEITGNSYGNYSSGINRQVEIKKNNIKMKKLSNNLNKERKKIQEMIDLDNKLEGNHEYTKLNVNAYRYHYIYFFLSAVILLILIFKAFMTKEEGPMDTVIIVSAILLIIYTVAPSLYTSLVNKIKSLIKK